MMSQIVMSICTASEPCGFKASSFFETFAPSVTMYRSSYSFKTYRLIRDVLPTACSPTRQTFTFMRRGASMADRPERADKSSDDLGLFVRVYLVVAARLAVSATRFNRTHPWKYRRKVVTS